MNSDTAHEDGDLIWLFEHLESIIDGHKPSVDQVVADTDFYIFKEYLINDIRKIREWLAGADDDELLATCEHLYDIIDWIHLINGARSENFGIAFERVFEQEFGDKHILERLYNESFDRWLKNKDGQYRVGGNTYSILDNSLYYRDRFKRWFRVEKETAFDLQPVRQQLEDETVVEKLNSAYRPTSSDDIIDAWDNQDFQDSLPDDFLRFDNATTTPEEYFDFTIHHIKSLLNKPVSIKELERWYGASIENLEDTIKLGATILDIVKDRRNDDSHTVYLLRDCLVFYEIHKTLDILNSKETSSDQLLIGRKFLSHKQGAWGYYIGALEALYEAHRRYPKDFTKFYDEYARLLDIFVTVNPGFLTVVNDLVAYIKTHIKTTADKVVIFDVGFQGSINLLIKYVIDHHINPTIDSKIETDIEIGVGAQWSKELFANRFKGDYFPFLNRVQLMARSEELYHYEFGNFDRETNTVRVKMGDIQWQRKATVELVVLVMIAKLSQT